MLFFFNVGVEVTAEIVKFFQEILKIETFIIIIVISINLVDINPIVECHIFQDKTQKTTFLKNPF